MRTIFYLGLLILYPFMNSCTKQETTPDDNINNTVQTNITTEINIIEDTFEGISLVVIGDDKSGFIVSFINEDNSSFEAIQDSLPLIMKDNTGNIWDVTGLAVDGPSKGAQLKATKSYMGYWFSWGTFFRGAEIYDDNRTKPFEDRSYLTGDWLIPSNEVHDGGPGKDGIPALSNPKMMEGKTGIYVAHDDLILGYVSGSEARAYPHKILDWHEIINDQIGGKKVVITYCPLTGTGIGWMQEATGISSTFGVSGLLYNSNLIPYDRETDSYWSQIRLDCVKGTRKGEKIQTIQLIETTWQTWYNMYPDTKVVSSNTGYSRNYDLYPYGDYKTSDQILFPVSFVDDRLHKKEIVHGVIINDKAKVYRYEHFK